ncbi:hypothetical protein NG796_01450 [Laspinema sp. A4]|uniref:hypothetical protein n=1 Tax=Laspinema sp. D2d TaxID=2953686 RepID=UPI0021BAE56F|nr:hypothetical protein [Laspinema sp. D2d]MCT7981952.1 hypothetical protein [Laspinema sp. D2d]
MMKPKPVTSSLVVRLCLHCTKRFLKDREDDGHKWNWHKEGDRLGQGSIYFLGEGV